MDSTYTFSNPTPRTSKSQNDLTPPPSPAEQPPAKKSKKQGLKVAPPQRPTTVDWETRLTLNEDREIGFVNSQEDFEPLYGECKVFFIHPSNLTITKFT